MPFRNSVFDEEYVLAIDPHFIGANGDFARRHGRLAGACIEASPVKRTLDMSLIGQPAFREKGLTVGA
jgi:hypothetical protein